MAGLTPAERKALMDEMKNEKVLPPKGETKKNAEIFKEGMKPPVDPDMGSMQPAKKAKGGKVKGYDEGGLLEGMKDIYMEGVKKVGDDLQRIAGTEKGKQLDKEAQKEMYKRASNAGMKAAAQELKNDRVRAEAGRYKKGGSVKTASSRADGIAQRGKTRGKMY